MMKPEAPSASAMPLASSPSRRAAATAAPLVPIVPVAWKPFHQCDGWIAWQMRVCTS